MVPIILTVLYLILTYMIGGFIMFATAAALYHSTWMEMYRDCPSCIELAMKIRKGNYITCCWIVAAIISIVVLISTVKLYADAIPGIVERMFS